MINVENITVGKKITPHTSKSGLSDKCDTKCRLVHRVFRYGEIQAVVVVNVFTEIKGDKKERRHLSLFSTKGLLNYFLNKFVMLFTLFFWCMHNVVVENS